VVEVGVGDEQPVDRPGELFGRGAEVSRRPGRVAAVDHQGAAAEVGDAGVADSRARVDGDGRPGVWRQLLEAIVVRIHASIPSLRERTYASSAAGPSSATSTAREPTTMPSARAAAARAWSGVEMPKPAYSGTSV